MLPLAAPPTAHIGLECPAEDIFMCLEKMQRGYSPPDNVIKDVNPYDWAPSNLPDGVWYLIESRENDASEFGSWKLKGEASKLFSKSLITGWRTTLEFFEGQVPHEKKTNWVMQQYWITRQALGENSKAKEASSLCRVFLGGRKDLDHEKSQKMAVTSKNNTLSMQLVVPNAHSDANNGSTRKPEADKDDETGKLTVKGSLINHLVENPTKSDYISSGDYLELDDLNNPASPSSSSENSSCFSMSSDGECFDPEAFLQEIESDSKESLAPKKENCKLSVSASLGPNEVVMLPATPASFIIVEGSKMPAEEIPKSDSSAHGYTELQKKTLQYSIRNQKENYCGEGPSKSHDVVASSSSSGALLDGERKAAKGRSKKHRKKYSCFMPFSFLF